MPPKKKPNKKKPVATANKKRDNGVVVTASKSGVNNELRPGYGKEAAMKARKEKETAQKIAIAKRNDALNERRQNALVDRDVKENERTQAMRKRAGNKAYMDYTGRDEKGTPVGKAVRHVTKTKNK